MKRKKQKAQKIVIKYILKLEDYKHCLEANQLENKIKHLEKNKLYVDKILQSYRKSCRIHKKTIN